MGKAILCGVVGLVGMVVLTGSSIIGTLDATNERELEKAITIGAVGAGIGAVGVAAMIIIADVIIG